MAYGLITNNASNSSPAICSIYNIPAGTPVSDYPKCENNRINIKLAIVILVISSVGLILILYYDWRYIFHDKSIAKK